MSIVFVDVLPSEAVLNLYLDGNFFLIVSTVSEFSLLQFSLKLLAGGGNNSFHTELYDHCTSRFDIPFDAI
jgi:hypothetical protein